MFDPVWRRITNGIFVVMILLITFIAGVLCWVAATTRGGHPPASILLGPIIFGWFVLVAIFSLIWALMLSGFQRSEKSQSSRGRHRL